MKLQWSIHHANLSEYQPLLPSSVTLNCNPIATYIEINTITECQISKVILSDNSTNCLSCPLYIVIDHAGHRHTDTGSFGTFASIDAKVWHDIHPDCREKPVTLEHTNKHPTRKPHTP